jgi:hypothetical protein
MPVVMTIFQCHENKNIRLIVVFYCKIILLTFKVDTINYWHVNCKPSSEKYIKINCCPVKPGF